MKESRKPFSPASTAKCITVSPSVFVRKPAIPVFSPAGPVVGILWVDLCHPFTVFPYLIGAYVSDHDHGIFG